MAVTVFSLYGLGWYMVDLDYYDPWYQTAPYWHKVIGIVLGGALLIRIVTRLLTKRPTRIGMAHERLLSSLMHVVLYLGLLVAVCTGYLMATADGDSVDVAGLFQIPALVADLSSYEELIWFWHERSTDLLVILALLHASMALKHHFWNGDRTLLAMLGLSSDK